VVTLDPNATEILFWLGCGGRVIGTDDFSNTPAAAVPLPKVGGIQPSVEKIVRLRPDLVIGSSTVNQSDVARALQGVGIPFLRLKTDRLSDIPTAAQLLASRVDCPPPSNAIAAFQLRLEAQRHAPRKNARVLVLVWPNPLYVAGRGTFADDLLQLTGAENAVSHDTSGWPAYSLESIVAAPPDVLLFPSKQMSQKQLSTLLEGDAVWRTLDVVKKRRYFVVDEDLYTRPGPRMADAATELNRLLDSIGAR
jgi:ABC-type Fe3+-hydroxamate transport system substrate-binding protein